MTNVELRKMIIDKIRATENVELLNKISRLIELRSKRPEEIDVVNAEQIEAAQEGDSTN